MDFIDFNMRNLLDIPVEKKDKAKKRNVSGTMKQKCGSCVKFKTSNRDDYFNDNFTKEYEVVKLKTSFDDKNFVKANGGKWNQYLKTWYTKRSNEALKDYFDICMLSNTF